MLPLAKSAADLATHHLASEANFPTVVPFLLGISDFVARHLPSEACIKRQSTSEGRSKVISDDVVGYVRLKSWETQLLDTRLFQRLRNISQLAFAKHVYPTLGYCRFEHTIGFLGRTSQILSALQENSKSDPEADDFHVEKIVIDHEPTLRLAALFHDVGHCIYSHASEYFMATLPGKGLDYPSADCLRTFFGKAFQLAKPPQIAEVISVAILLSPEIQHFITQIGNEKRDEVNRRIRQAAYFILGSPPAGNSKLLFLAQVISSGLDADKLDYMARESYYSGVPLGIDIPWLLSKLRLFKCNVKTLPRAYTSLKENYTIDSEFLALGLVSSGQLEFEEFCFARVSLYDKIYLHQKNRALTAQAHVEFRRFISRNTKYNCIHHWLDLRESDVETPTQQLTAHESLFQGMSPSINLPIADRDRHFHRAYAFGPRNSLTDPFGGGDVLDALPSVQLLASIRGEEFSWGSKIETETTAILRLLGHSSDGVPPIAVAVDTAAHLNIQQGHDSLYFQRFRKPASRWILPVDMIVDYYRRNRACGYVFAPAELCPYVALAAETVLWRERKQQFSQDDGVPTHLSHRVSVIKEKLSKAQYYEQFTVLRPASKYLSSAAASELMHKVAERLAGFQSYKQDRVTPQRVASFVGQFREPLQEAALRMCNCIELVEPVHVANCVVEEYLRLKSNEWNGKTIALVPLGSIIESGALLSYNFKNHSNPEFLKSQPRVETLSDNVVNEVEAIIFYDDNINSGSQLINVFAARLGVTLPADRKLGEAHGSQLSEAASERLKALPMHFVYGVAPEGVLPRVQADFERYFGIQERNISLNALHWLKESEKSLSGRASAFQHEARENLRKQLEYVGMGLMLNEGKTEEVARKRALGDENMEALIVFPYNVPTMTVLALWCEGTIKSGELNGSPWFPLVERRRARGADGRYLGDDA